jgi:hypothetical protein
VRTRSDSKIALHLYEDLGTQCLHRLRGEARVAFGVSLITAAGIFLLARANSFPGGCVAAGLIGAGAGGEAAITP